MFCPQCGQQQVSDITRFCSRCGFPMEGVMGVLSSGGMLPARYVPPGNRGQSPRAKGVKQGALMMLSTLPLVPLVAIFTNYFDVAPDLLIPITALVLFVGGLFRIFFALLMEDDTPQDKPKLAGSDTTTPQFERSASMNALPPASANATTGWRARPNTSEIYQPPSITENTTRLLDKDDPANR